MRPVSTPGSTDSLPRAARLHGAEGALRSLLRDVLDDMGIALESEGAGAGAGAGARADVVLALVQREDSVPGVLGAVAAASGAVPVIVLLPFEDERLRRVAMRLGARGCYALGTPLEALKRQLRELRPAKALEKALEKASETAPEKAPGHWRHPGRHE